VTAAMSGLKKHVESPPNDAPRQPRSVRLPIFLSDEPVGMGDAIKRATSTIGIKPCGGCAQRAARLNSLLTFSGRKQ
jgi:hypothetical protein